MQDIIRPKISPQAHEHLLVSAVNTEVDPHTSRSPHVLCKLLGEGNRRAVCVPSYAPFKPIFKDLLADEPITLRRKPDSWCFYYNFDQYLYVEHGDNPQGDSPQGVGVFGRFGLADDDTNPVEWLFNIGIGGKGIITGRDRDTFGLGYYYLGVSDELPGRILSDDGQGVEIWYNIEAMPWLHITPDLQVINSSRKGVPTTWVGGIRVKLDF